MSAVLVRSTDEEIARWKEAAHVQRISMNQWIRNVLNGVEMTPIKFTPPTNKPIQRITASRECFSRVAKGSYCKKCAKVH